MVSGQPLRRFPALNVETEGLFLQARYHLGNGCRAFPASQKIVRIHYKLLESFYDVAHG